MNRLVFQEDKGISEQKENKEENRTVTIWPIDKEKKKDFELGSTSTLLLKVENNECFDQIAIYTVEFTTKDQNTP